MAGISSSDVSGSKTSTSEGKVDYWVVYLTPDGEQIWDESYGASLRDAMTEMEITQDGSIVMAGHTESEAGGDKTEEAVTITLSSAAARQTMHKRRKANAKLLALQY